MVTIKIRIHAYDIISVEYHTYISQKSVLIHCRHLLPVKESMACMKPNHQMQMSRDLLSATPAVKHLVFMTDSRP